MIEVRATQLLYCLVKLSGIEKAFQALSHNQSILTKITQLYRVGLCGL